MKKIEWTSRSPEETLAIAQGVAKKLKPGTVVALSGNLGSGKTTFIKGLALGLGLKDLRKVTSPTFALMHIYPSTPPVYHFDLYRLESVKEIQEIGFEEFISDPHVIACVEWAEKAAALLPKNALKIHFEITDRNVRRIKIHEK